MNTEEQLRQLLHSRERKGEFSFLTRLTKGSRLAERTMDEDYLCVNIDSWGVDLNGEAFPKSKKLSTRGHFT